MSLYTPVASSREAYVLDNWFASLVDEAGLIGGAAAVKFFLESQLSRDVLREVWGVVELDWAPGCIDRAGFYSAMRLICILIAPEFAGYFPHSDLFRQTEGRTFPLPVMNGHPEPQQHEHQPQYQSTSQGDEDLGDDFGDFTSHPTTPVPTQTAQSTQAADPMASAAASASAFADANGVDAGVGEGAGGGVTPTTLSAVVGESSMERPQSSSDRMSAFDDLLAEDMQAGGGGAVDADEDWNDFADAPTLAPVLEPDRVVSGSNMMPQPEAASEQVASEGSDTGRCGGKDGGDGEDEFEDFEGFQVSPTPAPTDESSPGCPQPTALSSSLENVSAMPAMLAMEGQEQQQQLQQQDQEDDCDSFASVTAAEPESEPEPEYEPEPVPEPEPVDPFASLMGSQAPPAAQVAGSDTMAVAVEMNARDEDDWDDFDDFQSSPVKPAAAEGLTAKKLLRLVGTMTRRHKYEHALLGARLAMRLCEKGGMTNVQQMDDAAAVQWEGQYAREMGSPDNLLNCDDSIDDVLVSMEDISADAAAECRTELLSDATVALASVADVVCQLKDADADADANVDLQAVATALECELRVLAQTKRRLRLRTALITTHTTLPAAWREMLECLLAGFVMAESYREAWTVLTNDDQVAADTDARFHVFAVGLARLHDVSNWLAASCLEGGVERQQAHVLIAAAKRGLDAWPAVAQHCAIPSLGSTAPHQHVMASMLERCVIATGEQMGGSATSRPFCNLTLRPMDDAMGALVSDACGRFYRENVQSSLPGSTGFLCF